MKCILHWEKDGVEDSMAIEGSTIEDITETAKAEMDRRGIPLDDCWTTDFSGASK